MAKGLQKETHLGESMELAAILDFEKKSQSWNKFTCQILFVTQILLQIQPGCSLY